MKSIKDKPKAQTIYLWNIIGSFSNAVASVIFLAAVSRFTGSEESDIFSLAWSIAQLVLTIGTFQVRLFQATDVEGKFSFRQYLIFRFASVSVMIVSSVIYIAIHNYTGLKAAVIMALCIYKAIEALSDVYQGWFQQKERLDLAGKALSCRTISSLIVFMVVLLGTGNILVSCICITGVSFICLLAFEIRYMVKGDFIKLVEKNKDSQWFLKLLVTCLPLFLNSYLVMSIFNAPKMAIDQSITKGYMEAGMQTIYNIVFMPTSVINLVYIVFRPLITKMALEWTAGKPDAYLKLVRQVIIKLVIISIVILGGGYCLGIPALSIVYGVSLEGAKKALMILLIAGGMNTVVNVLDNALTVIRRQYTLIAAYVITWIYAELTASFWVKKMGLTGAAVSFLTSMTVLLVTVGILFIFGYNVAKKQVLQKDSVCNEKE